MRPNTLKKLTLSVLFLFLPFIVFAQSNRTQSVALVPFWGADETFIQEFGEELFKGVNGLQGYRSVVIDMTNLPDDVPEGGFPPYICPSPSLIKTNPIALTGELTPDPDDEEFWHLRLYLWEMADTRLVFSDELTAYDRDECAAAMPGMLEWLFSWLKRGGSGSGGDGEGGDTSNQYAGGKSVFITTSMPLQWIYVGGRFGWTPLRMQTLPVSPGANPQPYYVDNYWETLNGAITGSIAFFPESVPFFSRFALQIEGIFNYDFSPIESVSILPAALLKFQAYRQGSMLFSLYGGAYTAFSLKKTIQYVSYLSDFLPIGWTAGINFGGKIDPIPGIFFLDLRFSMDLFNTLIKDNPPIPPDEGYRRMAITVSIGYEFGFITKK
ncbi:MAG: hypothetical protein LBU85_12085 [Treponema sp.]|nr:hypothetical protein [Treponema sp.]